MRQGTVRLTGMLIIMVAMLSGITAAITTPTPVDAAVPKCAGKPATIVGTNKSEVIEGTKKRDVIVAKGGHDFIKGRRGGDIICGGAGDDTIFGSRGADKLYGGPGDDKLRGGKGVDMCLQGPGAGSKLQCELPKPVTLQNLCLDAGGTYSEQNSPTVYNRTCSTTHLSITEFSVFRLAYRRHCFQSEPGATAVHASLTLRTITCVGDQPLPPIF